MIFDDNPGLLDYPDEVLAIGLLHAQQEPSSAWYMHVDTMPAVFNTPLYWDDADLDHLKGSIVYHLVNMMKKRILSDWDNLIEPLARNYPELIGKASHSSYTWALSAIYSRAVEIIRHGATARCMPPLVDMANHNPHEASDDIPSLYYSAGDDSICLVASRERGVGDEVFVIYGHYPNSKLMYSYGFVVDDNPYRAIDLWPRVPATCYRAAEKESMLRSHPLTAEQTYDFRGTVRSGGYISPALLATVRIIAADESDMLEVNKALDGEMISARNELAALRSLHGLLVARMQPAQSEVSMNFYNMLHLHYMIVNLFYIYFRAIGNSWASFVWMPRRAAHRRATWHW